MDEYISKHEPIEEIKRIYCTNCNSYNGAMCRACDHQDDIDIIEDTKAADVQPVDRWISVKDRLPDATEATVLIWIKEGKADGIEISDCCHIGYWVKNSKEFCDIDWNVINGITHWMPLPEPPKDGDAE